MQQEHAQHVGFIVSLTLTPIHLAHNRTQERAAPVEGQPRRHQPPGLLFPLPFRSFHDGFSTCDLWFPQPRSS